jgi:hypothetical protein
MRFLPPYLLVEEEPYKYIENARFLVSITLDEHYRKTRFPKRQKARLCLRNCCVSIATPSSDMSLRLSTFLARPSSYWEMVMGGGRGCWTPPST